MSWKNESASVEVFRTNVNENSSETLVAALLELDPKGKINFDLEDSDKILRVESNQIISTQVVDLLRSRGYICEVL